MKSPWMWAVMLLAVAAAGGGGYLLGHRAGGKPDDPGTADEVKPVPTVAVVPLEHKLIAEEVTAFGTVVAPPSEIRVVSVPFESRVRKIEVASGQVVAEGQKLIEIEPSAATMLALEEARNTLDAAQHDLELVQERYDQKLATKTDLNAAVNAVRLAKARLNNLSMAQAKTLNAETAGIVSKVDVQPGQIVPIGGPLVEVAAQNQIEVKLGVESADASYLKVGQPVELQRLDVPEEKPVDGSVRVIGQGVDPASRLVVVFVTLPGNTGFLLDSFISGRFTRKSVEGLAAPRDAVLPDDNGFSLFTVKDGKAVKHTVKIGIENDEEAQVIADDLKEGDLVVSAGNLELEDGMAVQVGPPATQPGAKAEPTETPVPTQPVSTQPFATQPVATQPVQTQPVATSDTTPAGSAPGPATTQTSETQPAATQPPATTEGRP